ncbi:hypothetical protein G3O08_03995 [Cryomorpha ignava]|uniref:Redoxin domain-containing protein n=1 Tax=Cryomorpha ignava TaxID=101383 RepID=A0A7K3WLZ5_9FLAO|nr:hypothetical protein [Cryomorpha ignava]NEN22667.1 hypothetical protein [Cryomorpha ignava]
MKTLFNLISFILLLFVIFPAFGQINEKFPTVETEKVTGEIVEIPSAFAGKFILIGVGTSKKAEDQLQTWQNPLYQKFVAKTGLMDDMFNVELCFLPLFTGASQLAKDKVIEKIQENNEALVIDNVYVYAGNREPFTAIGIDDRSEPYFYLLDKSGTIVWTASGGFKQKYFDQIEEILTR